MQPKKLQFVQQSAQQYVVPQLQAFVESVCFFRGGDFERNNKYLLEGHPEGIFELIFQDDTDIWQSNDYGGSWELRDEGFIGGLHQKDYQLRLSPESEMIAVRFRPGAFKYFTAEKQHQFTDQCIHLSEVWGARGKKIHTQVIAAKTAHEKLQLIGRFLQEQLNRSQHSVIDHAVQSVVDSSGIIDLQTLEKNSCLSAAQFRKRFREEVGLSPKKYAKMIRISTLVHELEHMDVNKLQLTDLAYRFHYYDQSHFIKDFKSVIGKTPTQYIAAQVN